MELLSFNVRTGIAKRVVKNGREWLVAPLTSIVPGVLSGSKGALFYPHKEIQRNVEEWNGMPLTCYHPIAPNGDHVSAQHPGILEKQGIGEIRDSRWNGKLQHNGWFDVERTKQVDPRIYNALVKGEPIELSTGLYTDNDPAPVGANWKGRPYEFIARNYRPDHVAILPDQIGACSRNDGCGVLVNQRRPKPTCPT